MSQSRAPPLIDIMDLAINELIIKWYPALVEKEIFALKHIVYTYHDLHWGCAPEDEVITRIVRCSKKFRTESEASQALEQLIKKKIVYSVKTRPTWKGSRVFDFCQSEFAEEAMGTFDYIIQNNICAFFVPHKSSNSGLQ
ncbi:MAG: hypothetical protein ACHQ1D_03455 [Nitrososphaerales archaeon]